MKWVDDITHSPSCVHCSHTGWHVNFITCSMIISTCILHDVVLWVDSLAVYVGDKSCTFEHLDVAFIVSITLQ